jgi:hypothetical protein
MKGFPLPAFIFWLFAVMICFPVASAGEGGAQTQIVETEGSAPVAGGDLARAMNEAVRDALQKAVEQVAGRWFAPQDAARKSQAFNEQIIGRAEGFIQEYRVVSGITAFDVYTVAIRASVLADNLRSELLRLGLIRPPQQKNALAQISLTIRGIHTYGDYVKCRGILKDRIPGIREIILREASWSLARFDIAGEESVSIVAERLREKMAVDIEHQDERVLEVHLR